MFSAYDEKGAVINIVENKWSKDRLKLIREHTHFFCPVCQQELELKVGSVIKAHFAHKKMTSCATQNESEGEYHLKGKLDLYHWLDAQSILQDVKLEPYIPEIKQRPDILISTGKEQIPIEFQCSTIDSRMFKKRSLSYTKLQMKAFWILGAKNVKRVGSMSFLISPFQWLFAEVSSNGTPPKLYFYCTESKSFIVFTSIIPFSSRLVITCHQQHPLQSINFAELKNQQISHNQMYDSWFEKIKTFRLKPASYQSKETVYLNMFLYKTKHLPLSYLPSYAFLPLKTTYLIESPVYVWQGWILIFIDALSLKRYFSFKDVCTYFSQKVVEGKIKIRHLPQINLHYSYVIKEYLNQLCDLSILTQTNKNIFIKNTEIHWSSNLENIFLYDQTIREKLSKAYF